MPNTRRRRFSVQNKMDGRDSSKMQNSLQNSRQDVNNLRSVTNDLTEIKVSKSQNKILPNTSKNSCSLETVAEHKIVERSGKVNSTAEKNITASSSNIDLFNILRSEEFPAHLAHVGKESSPRVEKPANTETISRRREKVQRQHRIKVRSPKRRPPILESKYNQNSRLSIGTVTTDWEQELETVQTASTDFSECNDIQARTASNQSIEDMCRICHGGEPLTNELGLLISACSCRGTVGRVHVKCLERWLTESGKSKCELCGTRYATKRVHRYGVPKALLMWLLSQNAKQLMVDSLGIILMSPLAILAAWLSGRTLAGLMSPDAHSTPWPLASTFVLACMTLVCYYCWIVSAATRHALGWWIWYRSQYEVRLQFEEAQD